MHVADRGDRYFFDPCLPPEGLFPALDALPPVVGFARAPLRDPL